jgi:hypothetical protein
MTDRRDLVPAAGEFLVFAADDGSAQVYVRIADGTVWLSQKQISVLYDKDVRTINEHLGNVYEEGELDPAATIRTFRIVQTERHRTTSRQVGRVVEHYSLPAIIAVGYRVRSAQGTRFRQWATARLDEYLVKGFVMDDERLASTRNLGPDYFDELLERIRRIRASERRFYQKLTDVYARCSVDYDPRADVTKSFYATVQNKMHWAIHGHTAAEVVRARADATKPNMGLTNWKGGPNGAIRKADVTIAKNYLSAEELSALDRVVVMYLDYAEDQARKRRTMTMADWVAKLDGFLQFNEHNVLTHAGTVSQVLAVAYAEAEFEQYDAEQRRVEATAPSSDFDRLIEASDRLNIPAPTPSRPRKKP